MSLKIDIEFILNGLILFVKNEILKLWNLKRINVYSFYLKFDVFGSGVSEF